MADPARNVLKKEIKNVLKNSDNMLRTFRSQIENKYVIIFIGNTRNGKSTLVNFITETPLVAFQEGNFFKIEHEIKPNEAPTIGHGTLSHTTIPTIIEMKGRPDTVIVDAPGFDDNRGTVQEIINALYINQIKYSKGVRFVLVSDITNIINDNINYFLTFIETVHTIMPDFTKLKEAVSIIFTKDWKNYTRLEIIELFNSKILNVDALHCQKNLIKHFVEREDLIGLFRMPSSVGALTEEININVHGAIFNSLPVNLNEADIKFGISKSARIVLLETYLEFHDLVNNLDSMFSGFRTFVYNKFFSLRKRNLLELTTEQLQGEGKAQELILQLSNRIKTERITETIQIPRSLQNLYLEEVNRVSLLIETIGIEIKNGSDPRYNLNTIEEIRRKLEYVASIEKVLEINAKSENLLEIYQHNLALFNKDIRQLHEGIQDEIDYRSTLLFQIKSAERMQNRLLEVDDQYLFASFPSELLKMKRELEQYLRTSEQMLIHVYHRPSLQRSVMQYIHSTSSLHRVIKDKIRIINKHIENRNNEVLCKNIPPSVTGVMGTLMLYAGVTYVKTLRKPAQFAVIGSSFLLFAAFSWKSTYMRNFYSRIRRRYQQKRLFTKVTKLDDCNELLHYRMYFRG